MLDHNHDHNVGYNPTLQIPQVLPSANLIYPFSPQVEPHEFLTFQLPPIIPTSSTILFNFFPQFENTPLL